ncbi:MAG TPA: hypothetical protein DIT93_00645, partial [Pelagibacterium sp.]|nr:hypothetical protein [Pelagibacterium sp.]
LVASADAAADVFDGGAGTDTLDLSAAKLAVAVDLDGQSAVGEEIGEDTVTNIETVIGGSGDDTIAGSGGDETLHGGAGDDVIDGCGGDDEIHDGSGTDTVTGGEGDDRVVVALDGDDDSFDGGDGADTLDLSDTKVGV